VFLLFEEYERGEVIDTDEVAQDNRPSIRIDAFLARGIQTEP
jgi:hypothetical protein